MFYPSRTRTAPHRARHSPENAPRAPPSLALSSRLEHPTPDDVRPATRPRAASVPLPVPASRLLSWLGVYTLPASRVSPRVCASPYPAHALTRAHPVLYHVHPSRAPSCAVCVHDNASGCTRT